MHSLLRLASILIVFSIRKIVPNDQVYYAIAFSLGFAHYALSLIYAKKQMISIAQRPTAIFSLLALAALATGMYWGVWSLVFYFAIHHVFNEVYLLNREVRLPDNTDSRGLRNASIFLNLFIYIVVLRHEGEMGFFHRHEVIAFSGLVISSAAFFFYVLKLMPGLSGPDVANVCAFEIIGLFFVAISKNSHITFIDVVLYHFVFWGFYPLPKMIRGGRVVALKYVALNIVITGACTLVSPMAFIGLHFAIEAWYQMFRFFSYLHITLSFALSTAHPIWITRWLQPPAVRPV